MCGGREREFWAGGFFCEDAVKLGSEAPGGLLRGLLIDRENMKDKRTD
jgi:hypothetical protein